MDRSVKTQDQASRTFFATATPRATRITRTMTFFIGSPAFGSAEPASARREW
ncbi:MAG: hypothetical protein ACKOA9_07085 [Actinomycetota bacterium]